MEPEIVELSFPELDGAAVLRQGDRYFLDQRNSNMLATALPELEAGGVVMAVGAFHLPGEAGLIALLRQAGFEVSLEAR